MVPNLHRLLDPLTRQLPLSEARPFIKIEVADHDYIFLNGLNIGYGVGTIRRKESVALSDPWLVMLELTILIVHNLSHLSILTTDKGNKTE